MISQLPSPIIVWAPTGSSKLPLIELDRAKVQAKRKRIRSKRGSKKRAQADCSFGNFVGHLPIDAWPLFHAAKKTELATPFTTATVERQAMAFAAEYSDLFVWNTQNLRRIERSVFALEDFAEAGLAGRFGEAVAYLTMLSWGYVYWDRLAILWERASARNGMTHPERVRHAQVIAAQVGVRRPDLEPDFAFEKANAEVALMEAKGSFVHPISDNPSTKNDLRHALDQLGAWTGFITPSPAKSFAIGTYFRDSSDTTGDDSLIAFVDPPGAPTDNPNPTELPPDWIRRGNYGAWLTGMGFTQSGDALRRGAELGLAAREVSVVRIAGRRFAVVIEGFVMKPNLKNRGLLPQSWLYPLVASQILRFLPYSVHLMRDIGISMIRVLGIELATLRLIEESVLNSGSQSLLRRESDTRMAGLATGNEGFAGSIFPDGTLLGQMDPLFLADSEIQEFRL